jgi:hypothetical protein
VSKPLIGLARVRLVQHVPQQVEAFARVSGKVRIALSQDFRFGFQGKRHGVAVCENDLIDEGSFRHAPIFFNRAEQIIVLVADQVAHTDAGGPQRSHLAEDLRRRLAFDAVWAAARRYRIYRRDERNHQAVSCG